MQLLTFCEYPVKGEEKERLRHEIVLFQHDLSVPRRMCSIAQRTKVNDSVTRALHE